MLLDGALILRILNCTLGISLTLFMPPCSNLQASQDSLCRVYDFILSCLWQFPTICQPPRVMQTRLWLRSPVRQELKHLSWPNIGKEGSSTSVLEHLPPHSKIRLRVLRCLAEANSRFLIWLNPPSQLTLITPFTHILRFETSSVQFPPYYFGVAESRPEGLVDILVIGDSTTALVHNPGDVYEGSRFSMGELLKDLKIPGVGNIETRLCWGKGLNTIVSTAREAIQTMNHDNFIRGQPSRQILVLVGWSGNDVHGDYGYQGCTWIHQTRYLQSDADKKVAAEWPAKQKARVEQSIADLIELKEMAGVADIVVFGNGHHSDYALPPSYNVTLGKHFQHLSDHGVNCVSFELVAMRGCKYDRVHLDDSFINRSLTTRYLKGVVTFHLAAMEIMKNKDILDWNSPSPHRYGTWQALVLRPHNAKPVAVSPCLAEHPRGSRSHCHEQHQDLCHRGWGLWSHGQRDLHLDWVSMGRGGSWSNPGGCADWRTFLNCRDHHGYAHWSRSWGFRSGRRKAAPQSRWRVQRCWTWGIQYPQIDNWSCDAWSWWFRIRTRWSHQLGDSARDWHREWVWHSLNGLNSWDSHSWWWSERGRGGVFHSWIRNPQGQEGRWGDESTRREDWSRPQGGQGSQEGEGRGKARRKACRCTHGINKEEKPANPRAPTWSQEDRQCRRTTCSRCGECRGQCLAWSGRFVIPFSLQERQQSWTSPSNFQEAQLLPAGSSLGIRTSVSGIQLPRSERELGRPHGSHEEESVGPWRLGSPPSHSQFWHQAISDSGGSPRGPRSNLERIAVETSLLPGPQQGLDEQGEYWANGERTLFVGPRVLPFTSRCWPTSVASVQLQSQAVGHFREVPPSRVPQLWPVPCWRDYQEWPYPRRMAQVIRKVPQLLHHDAPMGRELKKARGNTSREADVCCLWSRVANAAGL